MTSCVLAFNGERLDPVSETCHLGNGYRAYSPVLMRFTRPDSWSPFGAGGINPYAYCAGDPVNRADPTGHMSWQAGLGIGLGILGILGAVFTGGASIAAAGSISAALSGASTVSLVVGTAALVADVTGIASAATEESNPQASAALGWTSLAFGILSLVGVAGNLVKNGLDVAIVGLRNRLGNVLKTGMSGRGATGHSLSEPSRLTVADSFTAEERAVMEVSYETTPQQYDSTPLYRGDTRSPFEIFRDGFKGRGENGDMLAHESGYPFTLETRFISFSKSKSIAERFGRINTTRYPPLPFPRKSYIYKVTHLDYAVDFGNEDLEIGAIDLVPASRIKSATAVIEMENGEIWRFKGYNSNFLA